MGILYTMRLYRLFYSRTLSSSFYYELLVEQISTIHIAIAKGSAYVFEGEIDASLALNPHVTRHAKPKLMSVGNVSNVHKLNENFTL